MKVSRRVDFFPTPWVRIKQIKVRNLLVRFKNSNRSRLKSKIWPNFSNKVVKNLILSKNANNKKCASKFVFFNEKKIEKDSDDF